MKITIFTFIPTQTNSVCWCGNSYAHTHEEESKLHFGVEDLLRIYG